jgi:hypothetical protein
MTQPAADRAALYINIGGPATSRWLVLTARHLSAGQLLQIAQTALHQLVPTGQHKRKRADRD